LLPDPKCSILQHSGKSFLLNQLYDRKQGFELGPTIDPQTRGIWTWSEPLYYQGADGETNNYRIGH